MGENGAKPVQNQRDLGCTVWEGEVSTHNGPNGYSGPPQVNLPPTAGSAGLTMARVVDPSDLRLAKSNCTTNTSNQSLLILI